MKLSINFFAITTLICLFSVAGFAQHKAGKSLSPVQIAKKQTTKMIEKLKLNEKQINTISTLNLAYANKRHALRKDKINNKEAAKKLKKALKAEKSVEMKQVLTAKQFDLYTKMEANRKGNKGKKNKNR